MKTRTNIEKRKKGETDRTFETKAKNKRVSNSEKTSETRKQQRNT